MKHTQNFIDRCYKDKNGTIRLFQVPNAPLLVWLATTIFSVFATHGAPARALDTIGFGALFTWAWLELFQGDVYLRRVLGAIVLVVSIVHRI